MASLACFVLVSGCEWYSHNPYYEYDPDLEFEPEQVIAQLTTYKTEGFELINETPFASQAIQDAWISIWVSNDGADDYRGIELDGEGSGMEIPVGAVIIREVKDASGEVKKLTVIARANEGSHPLTGDLWFATATPDGLIEDMANTGFLAGCGSCHVSRAADGFLFGVPRSYRGDEHVFPQ